MSYHGQKWLNCDSWGLVSGLKDAGPQKDQGYDVLDEPGLIVLNSVTVQTGLYNAETKFLSDR